MSVLDRGTTILPESADPETSAPPRRMSAAEFLALPDDGIHRELVGGRLWEEEMTYRNRFHATAEANVALLLGNWRRQQPPPRGLIVSGEAGFRWGEGESETIVGVDVAYVTPEQLAATEPNQRVFQGAPALAVEILSGSETYESVAAKVAQYVAAGAVVWIVDPEFQTVMIHRAGQPPEGLNITQEIDGAPVLPGFRVPVRSFFED
jgi:Uma2 family endonuclease